MNSIKFFTEKTRNKYLNPREGETKVGEKLHLISSFQELRSMEAQYVIFGVPEDIGIRGNLGKAGAANTWDSFLSSFLNIQVNSFNTPKNCVILGHLNCDKYMKDAENISEKACDPKRLGPIVEKIDAQVSTVVKNIIDAQKTPIIIGGGHNNAYGNIKGTAQGTDQAINVLNIDAHTDLRRMDYRHSGNGFSYAKEEGYLANYAILGLHKNYTPQYIFDTYHRDPTVSFQFFEDIIGKNSRHCSYLFKKAANFLQNRFGLEIDCDAIANFDSSAISPSGFSLETIRQFIALTKTEQILYLHIAEASAQNNPQIGKALSFMVSDFLR